MIVIVGLLLTNIFVAVALFACVKIRDKARGIGVAIILWMYFSLLFDALILFLLKSEMVLMLRLHSALALKKVLW